MSKLSTIKPEKGVFVYGDEVIHYHVVRQSALNQSTKRRTVSIKVHPDQRVVAIAPDDATAEAIQQAVLKKSRWVWQHLSAFRSQHEEVLTRHYVSGETQFYLGRRYSLKVLHDVNASPSVKLLRGKLAVVLRHNDEKKTQVVKALVNQWYQHRAKVIFQERLNIMLPKTTWVTSRPSLRILTMKKNNGAAVRQKVI